MRALRITFTDVSAHLLFRGDSYPCPTKGHPPFTHDRDEPVVVLYRLGKVVRVLPTSQLATADDSMFRGSPGPKPGFWQLTGPERTKLKRWATKRTAPKAVKPEQKPKDARVFTPDPGKVRLRRFARNHPGSTRDTIRDVDYLKKLSVEERAWLDQFDSETSMNRWRDKEGVVPMYEKGTEGRREIMFGYNRRVDDLFTHKEWRRKQPSDAQTNSDRSGAFSSYVARKSQFADTDPIELVPSGLTEDELIAAIDARAENED